ncbi:CPBP family intramembrane glutamic endopeptidase [Microbacterium sp. ZXX196]|uniref:CPBP family intramembrane glutamic endopeptidase n=1 Tax=Microbacterium sp. ZXX196 TaxID=2609291 RepID=UPI0012B6B214|nr:CPBP family intramembrane glutamic endopeptidase [Microbacterium sp. ZXX196]MTE23068.1 CPBP family intramembrane metalloprotease [Microbacterium sp. ZXX196]
MPSAARRPHLSPSLGPAAVVASAAVALLPFENRPVGYALLVAGVALAVVLGRAGVVAAAPRGEGSSLARDLALVALGLVIASSIPLEAQLDDASIARFGVALGAAVAAPYAVSRFVFRDRAIRFPWRGGGSWRRWQWGWLAAVIALGWLILPFYFVESGVYRNWPVVDDAGLVARLFVGVGAVGIWDELFFICTVFVLLRRHLSDLAANALQAVVFVSFLWELGYRAWGPALTIPFALLQAVIFLRTRSLAYVVTVHLLFDAVVFLVLVHAHNPGALDGLFLVSPRS